MLSDHLLINTLLANMEPEIHCRGRSTILQTLTLIGALSVRRKGMFLRKSERFLEGEEEETLALALAEDGRPLGSRYQSHHPAIGKAHLVQYPSISQTCRIGVKFESMTWQSTAFCHYRAGLFKGAPGCDNFKTGRGIKLQREQN